MSPNRKSSLGRIADRRLIASALGLCAAAGGLPLVVAAIISFCAIDANHALSFGALDGYRVVLTSGRIGEFFTIIERAMVTTALALLIAIPAAYWLASLRAGVRTLTLALLVAPWLVSDMLRAFGWQIILSPTGPVSMGWDWATHLGPLDNLRYNGPAVVLGLVSALLPACVLSVLAAVPNRSGSEWLAAIELGHPHHVFRLMAIGRAMPGIVFGAFAIFVLSCFAAAEAHFLDGPNQTSVQSIGASLVNVGVPSLLAFGTLLVVFVFGICAVGIVLYRAFANRTGNPERRGAAPAYSGNKAFPLARRRMTIVVNWLLDSLVRRGVAWAGIGAISMCWTPLLAVAAEAFWQPSTGGGRWTFDNFRLMFESEQLLTALSNSAGIASIVAFITVIVAFFLSLVVWSKAMRHWVLMLLVSLVILPGDAYSIGLIQILKVFGHGEGGWSLIVLAHTLWAVPFATGTLMLANQQVGDNMLEAALEYSRGPLDVIFRVVGRVNLGQIAGVALLAGTLSLNEYLRASYLTGSLITISNEVHGRLTAGLLPQNRGVFAAELVIVVISIATVLFVLAMLRPSAARGRSES